MDTAGVAVSFSNTATISSVEAAAVSPPAAGAAAAAARRTSSLSERIGHHLELVRQLHSQDSSNFHVNLVESSLEIIDSLVYGQIVPFDQVARLHHLSYSNEENRDIGTRALLHLADALRDMATSRNCHLTVEGGCQPDQYGLPKIPPIREQTDWSHEGAVNTVPPLFTGMNEDATIYAEEETNGPVSRNSSLEVNLIRVPPVKTPRRHVGHVSELNLSGKNHKKRNFRAASMADVELDTGDLIKSEMMGEDEFNLIQERRRRQVAKYEEMRRNGRIEERKRIRGRGRGKGSKQFACRLCSAICKNQFKYAAHMRYIHPKNPKQRAEARAAKAEREEERREEKTARGKKKEEEKETVVVTGKRERRSTAGRRPASFDPYTPPAASSSAAAAAAAATPTNKIYTCPMCPETLSSQYTFAAHMRYRHPKREGDGRRMKERMATVTMELMEVKEEEEPNEESEERKKNEDRRGAAMMIAEADVKREEPDEVEVSEENTEEEAVTASVLPAPKRRGRKRKVVVEEEKERENEKGEETSTTHKSYSCRVCARTFTNHNAVAGHTRHCANRQSRLDAVNRAAPSPQLRQAQQQQAPIPPLTTDRSDSQSPLL